MMTASPGCSVRFCFFSAPSQVLHRDLVGVAEHLDALVAGDVDQHAARDQRADLLDAELGEAAAGRDLVDLEAVVQAVRGGSGGRSRRTACRPGRSRRCTISSLLPRRLDCGFMNVRLMCTSKRRVPKNGILSLSTCAELDHLAGLDQLGRVEHGLPASCGCPSRARRRRPISRGSACFPAGGVQVGACACAATPPHSSAAMAMPTVICRM